MTAKPAVKAPKGRTIPAQGNALGNPPRLDASLEGAEPLTGDDLLQSLLKKRRDSFDGRGKYSEPVDPADMPDIRLPKGWTWASVEQLSAGARYSLAIGPFGSNLKVSDYRDEGVPLIFVRNIRAENFDLLQKFVQEKKAAELAAHTADGGDILITKMGDPPGDAAYFPKEASRAVITADCIKWRLAPELTAPKFFVYAIRSKIVQNQILDRTRGVAQKKISLESFRDVAIPLPPLDVQHRVVAEIEKQFTRLDAGVAALRRAQANLKRYRAAVLKAACEGRLVPTEAELHQSRSGVPPLAANKKRQDAASTFETGQQLLARILAERRLKWQSRGKYKEPCVPDFTALSPLPDGWTWASVEQLLREPLCNGVSVKGSDEPPGVRALRLSAMSNSGFDYSNARYLPLAESSVDDLFIKDGDFFMSRGNGSLHLVGRGTCAQPPPLPTIFPDTMIRLRLAHPVSETGWVPMLWPSHLVRSQIEIRVKTTAGIYKIAQPQVEGMNIPLPPLAEQARIVAEVERRLSVVEELEAVVTTNLQRATRLRQSIFKKAFTGDL